MSESTGTGFRAGRNLAMKVPPHKFESTVRFYREVLKLPHVMSENGSACFAFGEMRLWIDRVTTVSQAEIWLEVQHDDTEKAAEILKDAGVERCDEIEPLPEGFEGFWITNPADVVHLVSRPQHEANEFDDTLA